MIGNELKVYDGLTSRQQLNLFRNLYYNDGNATEYGIIANAINDCFTADVVPKSEVDTWYQLYHSIKEELKLEKMYHRETENLCDRYCIESQQAKKQVAREIFEEIDKLSHKFMNDKHYIFGDMVWDINELKKKYTEGKDEQASIQTDHKEEFKK